MTNYERACVRIIHKWLNEETARVPRQEIASILVAYQVADAKVDELRHALKCAEISLEGKREKIASLTQQRCSGTDHTGWPPGIG